MTPLAPRAFVLARLGASGPLPDGEALGAFNYVDSGHIDSFSIMALIVAIEEAFDIELPDEAFEADSFRTIGGLIAAIEAARA